VSQRKTTGSCGCESKTVHRGGNQQELKRQAKLQHRRNTGRGSLGAAGLTKKRKGGKTNRRKSPRHNAEYTSSVGAGGGIGDLKAEQVGESKRSQRGGECCTPPQNNWIQPAAAKTACSVQGSSATEEEGEGGWSPSGLRDRLRDGAPRMNRRLMGASL